MKIRKELLGYLSGLISIVVLFFSIAIVMLLNPNYDLRRHMISGLGIREGNDFFNVGMVIVGLLHLFFFTSIKDYCKTIEGVNKNTVYLAYLFGLVFSFSEMGVGLFPVNLFPFQHVRVAILFFNSSFIFTLLFGIILIQRHKTIQLGYISFGCFLLIFIFFNMKSAFMEWIMGIGVWFWIGIVSSYMILQLIKTRD